MKRSKIDLRFAGEQVTGLLMRPDDAKALYVLAHGAGVGIMHPSMVGYAQGLAERGIATLRFNFPFMEKGTKRPDPPRLAHVAVRAAVGAAGEMASDLPLFAGGRSFGGRMTSQAQSIAPLPNVRGLAFLGFPLHPPGKPSAERADHLEKIEIPMLFVSGSRDALAELELLKPLVKGLGKGATLHLIDQADHGLRVPAKSGRTAEEAQAEALDAVAEWMIKLS
jgi:predicted alpha/beta-hydrolase family hydrolase